MLAAIIRTKDGGGGGGGGGQKGKGGGNDDDDFDSQVRVECLKRVSEMSKPNNCL